MLAYGFPFGLWSSFAWAQQYVDRYAVDALLGREAAGVYIAAIQVSAIPFTLVGAVVSQFLTPIVFEVVGDGRDPHRMRRAVSHVMRGAWWLAFAGALIVAIYFFAGQGLTALLASPSYGIPNAWLATLAAGALLQVWAQQLTVLLLAGNRSRLLLATRTSLGIIGIPIAWFMTSAWGMLGAVFAYVANSTLFLLAMALMIGRLFGSAANRRPA
jgi:O-antigen/teichoic acid export membrane protein